MPRGKSNQNTAILEYALQHLERERDELQSKIDHIRQQLGNRAAAPAAKTSGGGESAPRKRRALSPEARKRIAAAQKRRWAEHRKAKAKSGE